MQTVPVQALLSRAKAKGMELGPVILRLVVGIWWTSLTYGKEDLLYAGPSPG